MNSFSSVRVRLVGAVFLAVAPASLVMYLADKYYAANYGGHLPWTGFVVGMFALAAAWFGGEYFVLRRVRSLVKATQAIMRGDLTARTGLPYGSGELSELARVFDQMAELLDQRDGERAQVDNEIRRHNRNLASLNILTSAVNSSLELSQILSG